MITKRDKAKVIVTALYNLDTLVEDNQNPVLEREIKRVARFNMEHLNNQHSKAVKILQDRL
jgi:uncharacterized protein (UPF0147 family)